MRYAIAITILIAACLSTAPGCTTPPPCEACGDPTYEGQVVVDDAYYHWYHLVCGYCSEPITDPGLTHFDQGVYHRHCFEGHVRPHCYVCEEPIDDVFAADDWGGVYHPRHEDVDACRFCARRVAGPFAAGSIALGEDVVFCSVCSRTSVVDAAEARELVVGVTGMIAALGLDVDTSELRIVLASPDGMPREASDHATYSGYTSYVQRADGSRRPTVTYVLRGMPRTGMIYVLAHELTHVWQVENMPGMNDRELVEGSANYIAALVMQRIGGEEADYVVERLDKDEDPIYGGGYRRVKRFANSTGLEALLEELQRGRPRIP